MSRSELRIRSRSSAADDAEELAGRRTQWRRHRDHGLTCRTPDDDVVRGAGLPTLELAEPRPIGITAADVAGSRRVRRRRERDGRAVTVDDEHGCERQLAAPRPVDQRVEPARVAEADGRDLRHQRDDRMALRDHESLEARGDGARELRVLGHLLACQLDGEPVVAVTRDDQDGDRRHRHEAQQQPHANGHPARARGCHPRRARSIPSSQCTSIGLVT
jgi:hypothetical protein